jgi:alkylation response protein AidB-like acyl-CoA dehydrogenase
MDFELTEEQRMLKESARRLMERDVTPYLDGIPPEQMLTKEEIHGLLGKLTPLQYLSATVPEEDGGGGLDLLTFALMLEELDYRVFGPVLATSVVADTIRLQGPATLKEKCLPPLLSGEMVACSAVSEPDAGSDIAAIETRAVLDGSHYVLNGRKAWITNGPFADIALVLASEDPDKGAKGLSRFVVVKEDSAFEAEPIKTIAGWPIPILGDLVFKDCRIPEENRIGTPGEGLKETLIGLQASRCLTALNSVVIAQKAIDHALRYAKERHQFGKPIGQFQLIQSMIAEMITTTDAARLLIYRAIGRLEEGVRCAKEVSMAKYYASEVGVKVASTAIQVHGAYGYSPEYPVQQLYKSAEMLTVPDGTTQIQKLIVAGEALDMQAFA